MKERGIIFYTDELRALQDLPHGHIEGREHEFTVQLTAWVLGLIAAAEEKAWYNRARMPAPTYTWRDALATHDQAEQAAALARWE